MPYRRVFDVVWSGRRNLIMMASQIDRTGNQNISAIGPWAQPKAQLVGVRGAPGNTVNHTTSYWVPNHSTRSFVEQVDVVSGVGYARAAAAGPSATRFHEIRFVVSNLGVFDFATPDQVDAAGVGPSRGHRRRRRRGHRVRPRRPRRRPRHPRCRRPRSSTCSAPCSTRRGSATARSRRDPPGAAHPLLRPGRRPLPHRPDRHGLGGRAPPGGRHRRGRRARHPGLGHDDLRRAGRRHRRGAVPHRRALRRQHAHRRGRRRRPGRADDRQRRPGGQLRPGPEPGLVDRCRTAGLVVMPTIGARRHAEKVAEWGVDAVIAQGGEGGGHTGTVPTSLLTPAVVDAVGDRVARDRRRRVLRRARPGGRAGLRRVGHRHGDPLPAHPGEPGARRGEAALPADPGDRHRGVDRRSTAPRSG